MPKRQRNANNQSSGCKTLHNLLKKHEITTTGGGGYTKVTLTAKDRNVMT